MQSWQIKGLEIEQSALKCLDGVIAGHELVISISIIYLFIVSGICLILLLCSRGRKWRVRPVIVIQIPGPPPPPPETFNPFPPHRDCDCEHDDDW
jgi:hypothetical protein